MYWFLSRQTVRCLLTDYRSVIIDHLLNNYASEDTKFAFLYCHYKDQAAQTASNLIACLDRQIIGRPQELPQQLAALHKELQQQNRRPSFKELKRLLVALCNQYTRIYIVVDALDECEVNYRRRLLLPVFKSLPNSITRLFVTSRPNNEDIFQTFSKASQITIAARESDLRQYITEKIEERRDLVNRLTPELKKKTTSTISARASGMYEFHCFCSRLVRPIHAVKLSARRTSDGQNLCNQISQGNQIRSYLDARRAGRIIPTNPGENPKPSW